VYRLNSNNAKTFMVTDLENSAIAASSSAKTGKKENKRKRTQKKKMPAFLLRYFHRTWLAWLENASCGGCQAA
jgi:hypothetical protein